MLKTAVLLLLSTITVTEYDQRFIDGLVRRGLFETAVRFCDEQRTTHADSPDYFVQETIYVLARQAIAVNPDQRKPILDRLDSIYAEFQPEKSEPFTSFKIRMQQTVSDQLIGDLYRREHEIIATENSRSELADKYLNRSVQACKDLNAQIDKTIAGSKLAAAEIKQLVAMKRQTEFQNAVGWKSIAQTYPKTSEEQIDCMQRAFKSFTEIGVLEIDDPIVWQSRLERIICLRLSDKTDAAIELLDKFIADKLSQELLVQATSEGIRCFISKGDTQTALAWATQIPDGFATTSDFDLARLEAYLANWMQLAKADDSKESEDLLKQCTDFAQMIKSQHGDYWGQRAQMLIIQSAGTSASGNVNIHKQLAEDAFRRSLFDEAMRQYDLASDVSEKAGNADSACNFALLAASVASQQAKSAPHPENIENAAVRFCNLAIKWPKNENSPQYFLHGIEFAGQLVAKKHKSVDDYITLQKVFLKLWPENDKAKVVAQTAAKILEQLGRYEEALEVSPEFDGYSKKMQQLSELVQSGEIGEALIHAEYLYRQKPNDMKVAEKYGEILSMSTDAESRKKSQEFWRKMDQSLEKYLDKKGDSRYELAWKTKEMLVREHIKIGNKDKAKELIRLLKVLHPNLGSPVQKERFERLQDGL